MATWKEFAMSTLPGSTLYTCTLHCMGELLVAPADFTPEVWAGSRPGSVTTVTTIAATPMIHEFHLLVLIRNPCSTLFRALFLSGAGRHTSSYQFIPHEIALSFT